MFGCYSYCVWSRYLSGLFVIKFPILLQNFTILSWLFVILSRIFMILLQNFIIIIVNIRDVANNRDNFVIIRDIIANMLSWIFVNNRDTIVNIHDNIIVLMLYPGFYTNLPICQMNMGPSSSIVHFCILQMLTCLLTCVAPNCPYSAELCFGVLISIGVLMWLSQIQYSGFGGGLYSPSSSPIISKCGMPCLKSQFSYF